MKKTKVGQELIEGMKGAVKHAQGKAKWLRVRRVTKEETEKYRKAIEAKTGKPRAKRKSKRKPKYHPCGKCELSFDFCRC